MGRPKGRDHTHDEAILLRLAAGETLRQICQTPDYPTHSTVLGWCENEPLFADRYARARRDGLDALAEEMIEIADDATNDFMTRTSESGQNKVLDAEHVNRSRLRIDARKWLLSKLRPDKYGDYERIDTTAKVTIVEDELAVAQRRRAERQQKHTPLPPS